MSDSLLAAPEFVRKGGSGGVPAMPKLGEDKSGAEFAGAKMAKAPIRWRMVILSGRNNRHESCWLNFRCLANAMSLTS
jgi:hypothetical protein